MRENQHPRFRSRDLAVATAAAFLGGCTTNPFTGEQEISDTAAGAAIGAGVGAVIGALTGDNGRERRKRALIGAGVGAYMDYQEAKLRERLQGIDPRRVIALGFGERSPAASNATPEGRSMNRRVVLTLVPLVAS